MKHSDKNSPIIGGKEKKGQFVLDGLTTEQVEKYRKDFFNNMHSKNAVNISLLKDDDVQDIEFNGLHVMFFYVPQADRTLRPVYCGKDPYSGTYRRYSEGDYHCSPEEIRSMYADANLANPQDGRVLRTDRKNHTYGVTYAGLLMFGTYSAIMDANPNFFPDYQEIIQTGERWINRIYPDGNWESNLFQFYRRVLPILQGFLPRPFQLQGNLRQGETSAHIAIREAFTNALVHADYSVNASLNIYKYPNSIVFSNPGTLLISIQQYYQGGESVCRNKYLQTMFMFLGSAEKAGSGSDKIMHGWDEQNWKRPILIERSRPNKVELTMAMVSLLDEKTIKGLEHIYGERLKPLTIPQKTALALAYSEEEINNERLQTMLGMHRADITQMLSKLTAENYLHSQGHGRGTTYHVPITQYNMATSDGNMETSDINMATSDGNMETLRRYTKEQTNARLLEICDDWRTPEYIAEQLGRDLKYVRNFIIPKSLDIIERLYKENPNHPAQKYRRKHNPDYL